MEQSKKAYKEIFELLEKHKGLICFDVNALKDRADVHLFGLELLDVHGLELDPVLIRSLGWNVLRDNVGIGWFGSKHNRTISWPDDGKQPEDELLLLINFPTGPFVLGSEYAADLFYRFFHELKSYKPKYCDSHNSALYFSMDNAADVFNDYDDILRKYKAQYQDEAKMRRKAQLQKELNDLEK